MTDSKMITGITPNQILSERVGAAHDMMQYILSSSEFESDNELPGVLWGALNGVEIILQQAREYTDALPEMCHESKPATGAR